MSATLEDLFAMTEAVTSASVVVLTNNGVSSIPVQRSAENLSTPFVSLQVVMNGPLGHVHNLTGTGSCYDAYNGTINTSVFTDRMNNSMSHSVYVSKVLNGLCNASEMNKNLPYHTIEKIFPSGTTVSVEENQYADCSVAALNFILFIRQEAWP